jgi:Transposase DDE domain group 1
MAQGQLGFQYEEERREGGMTALGGLPVYMDLAHVVGLGGAIDRHLHVRGGGQGWSDRQVVMSVILLNIAGGECVDDLREVEGDEGFCRVMRRVELQGMKRRERRELERRWRKERRRAVPSPSSAFRYLEAFHDEEQEKLRVKGKAFIPAMNEHLQGLCAVNKDLVGFVQRHNRQETATLDTDATLVETHKGDALWCYKHFKSYQPFNVWWAEQAMVLHTEFRDGNVPAGYEQLRVFQEALEVLPEGVKRVRMRSDTAGYQHDLLRWCEEGKSERFGRIEFAVGCDVTGEFKVSVAEVPEGDWGPLYVERDGQRVKTDREWAEVCFVPNEIGHSKKGPVYRYMATREPLRQLELPGMEVQRSLPFPTVQLRGQRYKVFGIVTNMDWEGEELISWVYKRCGKSEEAHSVMKEDMAGGRLPSGKFGENAAWWWMMVLALNLNSAMKGLVLGGSWVSRRMKAIRYHLINIPGRVLERSRRLIIRLSKGHPSLRMLLEARKRINELALEPSG